MKLLITTSLLLLSQLTWSQTKVSVSDGDWNNPLNWSPAAVPIVEDSVIINHEIDFAFDLQLAINHLIIGTNGILDGNENIVLAGSLKVDGELVADTLILGGGNYYINNGLTESNQFTTTNLMNTNNGYIDILGIFTNVEPFINTSSGVIETLDVLTSSDADFENNGVVYIEDWTNEGTVLGVGSFCVENCFQNLGTITGSLDVCDATFSGLPCDLNIGTIAPTVTMCTNGPCSGTSGLSDGTLALELSIFPNPSQDGQFHLSTDATIQSLSVFDLTGRKMTEQTNGDFNHLDLSSLQKGDYLIVFQTATHSITKRIALAN